MRVAQSAARAVSAEAPASTTDDLESWRVIVARPFPHIARHVEEAPPIGRIAADTCRTRPVVVGARAIDRVTVTVGARAAGAAGVFPCRFRREPESRPAALRVQTPQKCVDLEVRHPF